MSFVVYSTGKIECDRRFEADISPQLLVTDTYNQYTGTLSKTTYGNNHVKEFEYDKYGRLTSWKGGNTNGTSKKFSYLYDTQGLVRRVSDHTNYLQTKTRAFSYDLSNRLIGIDFENGGSTGYSYDKKSQLTKESYSFGGHTRTTPLYKYNIF